MAVVNVPPKPLDAFEGARGNRMGVGENTELLLDHGHGQGGIGDDLAGELKSEVLQLLGRDEMVQDAAAFGPLRVEGLSGEEHLRTVAVGRALRVLA